MEITLDTPVNFVHQTFWTIVANFHVFLNNEGRVLESRARKSRARLRCVTTTAGRDNFFDKKKKREPGREQTKTRGPQDLERKTIFFLEMVKNERIQSRKRNYPNVNVTTK